MTVLHERDLTLSEAAYVAGVSERVINLEIEAHVVTPKRAKTQRRFSRDDAVYLTALREMRAEIAPKLRKRLRSAVGSALGKRELAARVAPIELSLEQAVREVEGRLGEIEHMREAFIECRPGVLAGEPVIKGTRISPYFVAGLVRRGLSEADIADELDLAPKQIEAATLFARVSPRRGRPRRKPMSQTVEHVPAD